MKSFLIALAFTAGVLADGAQYQHPQRPFSFTFDDAKWELVNTPAAPAKAEVDKAMEDRTLVTVQRRQADEKYRARFSVVVDDPAKISEKGATPLEAYLKHAVGFLKSQRFHILSTDPIRLPGVEGNAYEVVAHQRDFGLTFRQVIFLKKNEAYLLTAATRTNKFDEYKGELDGLFKSFALK